MDNWLRGCDLSHWNNEKDYKNVFNFADFFILKATEGRRYIDATYKARFKELSVASKCVGSYHFYKEGVPVNEQYRNIINNVDGFNYPYFLDVEERGTNWSNVFELANKLTKYYGRKPIIYTNYSMYTANKGELRKAYNWWIARYNNNVSRETMCKNNIVMWQYDDNSTWNGKAYKIDGNWFKGTYHDFMRLGVIE